MKNKVDHISGSNIWIEINFDSIFPTSMALSNINYLVLMRQIFAEKLVFVYEAFFADKELNEEKIGPDLMRMGRTFNDTIMLNWQKKLPKCVKCF